MHTNKMNSVEKIRVRKELIERRKIDEEEEEGREGRWSRPVR